MKISQFELDGAQLQKFHLPIKFDITTCMKKHMKYWEESTNMYMYTVRFLINLYNRRNLPQYVERIKASYIHDR